MSPTRKIVVLGANSFSGQDFVDLLLDDPGNEVIGVSRSPERTALFLRYKLRADLSRYRYYQFDMNWDMPALLQLLDAERPGGSSSSPPRARWPRVGSTPSTGSRRTPSRWRTCEPPAEADYLERYLHVSSPEVYGTCVGSVYEDAPFNPSTPMQPPGGRRSSAEHLPQAVRLPLLTVRSTNVYGARQQLFKIIRAQ